jgi:hypothetical protein
MAYDHPPFNRLTDLVKGDLSGEQQAEIAGHVATCSDCAAEVGWLEHILELYRTDDHISAPPAALARVRCFFPLEVAPQREEPRRRITAVLTFDSADAPLAIGIRSDMAVKRQLVFRAEEFELDLHIVSAGSRWIVSGQVLGSDEDGHAELLEETGTPLATASLNDLRQFTLPPVTAGSYTLMIQLNETAIEVPSLKIGG